MIDDHFDELFAGYEEGTRHQASVGTRNRSWIPMACVAFGATVCAAAAIVLMTPRFASVENPAVQAAGRAVEAPVVPPSPDPTATTPTVRESANRTWVEGLAKSTGIPERALLAYTGASIRVVDEFPGCGIGWNTLAGIGFVESEHGTIYGSAIREDGVATPAIIGIPLTGDTTLAIRDSDGGAMDGDSVWDRAVGPMQFIPQTWEEWGADGDGDGIRDPHNIDDASLAAARYLCASGGDLTQDENWIAAVHAYNPSVEYNNRVAEAASHYANSRL